MAIRKVHGEPHGPREREDYRPEHGLPDRRPGARFRVRPAGIEPPPDLQRPAYSEPRLFRYLHPIGRIAVGEALDAEFRLACQCHHGIDGSGREASSTSHFSWRNDNISIYKPFTHQHLAEINQSLSQLQKSYSSRINFIPVRGNFSRGIFATTYIDCKIDLVEIRRIYEEYYDDHSFTFITDKNPDLKQVVNTNKCLIHLQKIDDKLLIISMIDNLLKGASGQAVHNMNLLFGLEETVGLHLKPSAF